MLEAGAEVDRRSLTVAVALAVAAGERLALLGPPCFGAGGALLPRSARVQA